MRNTPNIDPAVIGRVMAQLRTMDPETLRETVRRTAIGAGADPRKTERNTANAQKLREQLSGLTEADVRRLAARIRPETLDAVMAQLKRDGLI